MTKMIKPATLTLAAVLISGAQAWAGSAALNQLRGQAASLGLEPTAAAAAPAAQDASAGQRLRQLAQENGVSMRSGETAYDVLRDLFNNAQAPSQADVTGSFSGETFMQLGPDHAAPYGLASKVVAGTLAQKFELVFTNEDKYFTNPKLGVLPDPDLGLMGYLPEFDDSNTGPVQFGGSEVKVKYLPGNIVGAFMAPIYMDLKIRKAGSCLVALVQTDHMIFQDKPDWIGYFCR